MSDLIAFLAIQIEIRRVICVRSNVHFWYLSLSDFRGRAAGEKLLKEGKK